MGKLEQKQTIKPLEWMIMLLTTCIGAQSIIVSNELFAKAQQFAWISCILGGMAFAVAASVMLWLTLQFPEQTMVEFAHCLWGRWGGFAVTIALLALFMGQICTITQGFAKVITLFMFDRTPPEVIALVFLLVCVYCALQDIGTILRVQQFLFVTTIIPLLLIWSSGLLNIQIDSLRPLWPLDWPALLNGALHTWSIFSGYELVLLLGPYFLATNGRQLLRNTWIGFGAMTALYAFILLLVIGVLTVAGAQAVPYPSLMVVRSVELPGTFIERLENYLLLIWIPVVFDTVAVMLFATADILRRYLRLKEQPVVIALLLPILYSGAALLDRPQWYEQVGAVILWLGILFSFGIIPLLALTQWWRLKQARQVYREL